MKCLTLILTLSASILTSLSPRCWIGVIDQIDPPWVSVIGERGEHIHLSIDRGYPDIQEGDWVIYWTQQNALEQINSPQSRTENKRLKSSMNSLLSPP